MKKIKDERLILRNLKNIRIAYVIQMVGMIIVLALEGRENGVEEMTSSPLWIVLLLSNVILILLSMPISLQVYESKPEKLGKMGMISIGIGVVAAILAYVSGAGIIPSALSGGLLALIFFVISYFTRKLAKKYQEE